MKNQTSLELKVLFKGGFMWKKKICSLSHMQHQVALMLKDQTQI